MIKKVIKMNYYNGLFLDETDFKTEQEYNIQMRRLMNWSLNKVNGILCGLDVKLENNKYKVTKGIALSSIGDDKEYGAEIVLDNDYELDSGQDPGEYYVTIEYYQEPIDKPPDLSKGDKEIHLEERPKIGLEPVSQGLPKKLILAKVKFPPENSEDNVKKEERIEIGPALRTVKGKVRIADKVCIGEESCKENSSLDVKLDVGGTVKAEKFEGDGTGLTNIGRWTDIDGKGIFYKGGSVGIGTSSPSTTYNLHIDPDGPAGILIGSDKGGEYTGLVIGTNQRTKGYSYIKTTKDVVLSLNPGDDSGNVGIGTTNPSHKLHIKGNIRIEKGQIIQDDWINATTKLNPGWKNYSDDYNLPGYFRDRNGIVHLRGALKAESLTIGSNVIFNLEYKPEKTESHTVYINIGDDKRDVFVRCEISATGDIKVNITDPKVNFFPLDGITFRSK